MDIETLQQTNKQLIETLDELNKIRADGKVKRANAEQELGRIEGELRQKMLEIDELRSCVVGGGVPQTPRKFGTRFCRGWLRAGQPS